jgi:replication factor C subunit 2/4
MYLIIMTKTNIFNQEEINELFEDSYLIENESESDDDSYLNNKSNKYYTDEIPLVEKYRPKTLDDIVQQDEIVKVLKNTIITGEMPHLLFHGGSGTGKTSTILALVMQLFGPTVVHDRVIELNASDERGIGTVRNKIITFTKIAIGSKDKKYPCPDFKVVILDEADAMTPEAQEALRKVMEKKCNITRFCFICNYINEIIDPIVSRCTQFRFKPLNKQSVIDKITKIAFLENIKINKKCIDTIYNVSEGDLRRAIMILQNTKYIINYTSKITPDAIIKFTGGIDSHHLKDFWKIILHGNCSDIRKLTILLQRQGYQVIYILNYLKKCLLESKLNDIQKSKISLEMCRTDKMLTEGSDEYLQILNILLYSNMICQTK